MMPSYYLVCLIAALVWVTFEIQTKERLQKDSKATHNAKSLVSLDSLDMKDQSMPTELNQYLSRKNLQFGEVVPKTDEHTINVDISDPIVMDDMEYGMPITTGIAQWKTASSNASMISDFGSSTTMQGRTDQLASWIGSSTKLSANTANTTFNLQFHLKQPDTIIVSLHFRTTGATNIDIVTPGMALSIYRRDTHNGKVMGGTSRSAPESCTSSFSLGTGKHTLSVSVRSNINRPAVFWGIGTIGGGIRGNIS